MSATARFKKDFGYYLLGIIVPGLLNAAMVPILKHLLGTEDFGSYSLKFNFLLLLIATVIGGLYQSIIRFRAAAEKNLNGFYYQVFSLGRYLLFPIAVPSFLIALFYFHQSILFSVLFSLCTIGCGMQNMAMGISQAGFQSKFIMLSEGIRAIVFFVFGISLLLFFKSNTQEILFFSLLSSYFISIVLLLKKNKVRWQALTGFFNTPNKAFETVVFLKYGFPLAMWSAVYYFFTYLDKPYVALDFNLTVQGNYQAMFDIIFRGITILMSPFPIAVLPILSQALEEGNALRGLMLLKKLVWLQMGLMVVGCLLYWFVAFKVFANILSVPINFNYKTSGLLMIIACMVWQIGLLLQKPYELAKKTGLLLKFMLIALVVYFVLFIFIRSKIGVCFYQYTLPFLIAGIVYNILCTTFKKTNNMA